MLGQKGQSSSVIESRLGRVPGNNADPFYNMANTTNNFSRPADGSEK